MYVCALGVPFMLASTTLGTIIRAEGAVKEGIVGNIVATFVNILLDPLFILAFGMGVAGAAAATVIGNLVGTLYYVYFMRKKAVVLNMSIRLAAKNRKECFPFFFWECPMHSAVYCPDLPLHFPTGCLGVTGQVQLQPWRQQESLRC